MLFSCRCISTLQVLYRGKFRSTPDGDGDDDDPPDPVEWKDERTSGAYAEPCPPLDASATLMTPLLPSRVRPVESEGEEEEADDATAGAASSVVKRTRLDPGDAGDADGVAARLSSSNDVLLLVLLPRLSSLLSSSPSTWLPTSVSLSSRSRQEAAQRKIVLASRVGRRMNG